MGCCAAAHGIGDTELSLIILSHRWGAVQSPTFDFPNLLNPLICRFVRNRADFLLRKRGMRTGPAGMVPTYARASKPMIVGAGPPSGFASPTPPQPFKRDHGLPRSIACSIFFRVTVRRSTATVTLKIGSLKERPSLNRVTVVSRKGEVSLHLWVGRCHRVPSSLLRRRCRSACCVVRRLIVIRLRCRIALRATSRERYANSEPSHLHARTSFCKARRLRTHREQIRPESVAALAKMCPGQTRPHVPQGNLEEDGSPVAQLRTSPLPRAEIPWPSCLPVAGPVSGLVMFGISNPRRKIASAMLARSITGWTLSRGPS